jgi:hypothetical protein
VCMCTCVNKYFCACVYGGVILNCSVFQPVSGITDPFLIEAIL